MKHDFNKLYIDIYWYKLFVIYLPFWVKKEKKRVSEKGKINWQWNNEDDQLQKKNHDQRMNKIPNLWNFY